MVDSTCVEYVTQISLAHIPTDQSTQLAVLSIGFNLEHVAALLIKHFLDQDANRIFCVVLPDGLRNGTVTRVANALRPHLRANTKRTTERKKTPLSKRQHSPQQKDKYIGNQKLCVSSAFYYKNVSLHVIDEGTSTKDRCSAFQRGGIVVCSSRTLCADMLHRRLSTECIGLVIILFPLGSVVTAMHETITPSLAFCVEMLLCGVNCHGEYSMQTTINNPMICGNRNRCNKKEDDDGWWQEEDEDISLPMACTNSQSHRPRVVMLSNHPVFMQYLVQRHHIGLERFTHQMHIGDIELFPRFRLEFIKHFEQLAKTKPLRIDRMNVDVNTSTQVLDRLLELIILEVLNELHVMYARLERAMQSSSNNYNNNHNNTTIVDNKHNVLNDNLSSEKITTRAEILRERRRTEAEQMDEDSYHLLPRARARYEDLPSSSSPSLSAPSHRTSQHMTLPAHTNNKKNKGSMEEEEQQQEKRKSLQYIYKPWRDKTNSRKVHFALIGSEICTEVQINALDTDLALLLRANEPNWPYRALVESLLDVRHLRRSLRGTSAFDFVFALDHALEKRVPQKGVFIGNVAPPAALWTLSSHFADVVTVATERIGQVIRVPLISHTNTPAKKVLASAEREQMNEKDVEVIDIDSDEDDDGEEDEEEQNKSNNNENNETNFRMMLVPNSSEPDQELDLMYRLVTSWARDVCRKTHKRQTLSNTNNNNNSSNNNAHSVNKSSAVEVLTLPELVEKHKTPIPPAFLIFTSNQRELVRCVERLIHTKRVFDRVQLNHFLIRYQMRCGISVEAHQPSCDESEEHSDSATKSESETSVKQESYSELASSTSSSSSSCSRTDKDGDNNKNTKTSENRNDNNITCTCNDKQSWNKKSSKKQIFEIDDDGEVRRISLSEWLASCDGVIDVEDEDASDDENVSSDEKKNGNDDDDENDNKKASGRKTNKLKRKTGNGNTTNPSVQGNKAVKEENAQTSRMLFTQYSPPVIKSAETATNQRTSGNKSSINTCISSPYSFHHILLTQPTVSLDAIHEEEEEEELEQEEEYESKENQKTETCNTTTSNVHINEKHANHMSDPLLESAHSHSNSNKERSNTSISHDMIAFEVESLGRGFAILTTSEPFVQHTIHARIGETSWPRLVVVDANTIHDVDVVEMIHGTHISLQRWISEYEEEEEEVVQQQTKSNTTSTTQDTNHKLCEMKPCAAVRRILLMHQSVQLLRMMEMVQDVLDPQVLSEIKIQLISSPIGEADFTHVTQQEREAFQSLAHAKATLTGTLLADRASQRRTLEELQSIVINPRGRQASRQQNHLQLQRSKLIDAATQLHASSTDMPINAHQLQKREKEKEKEKEKSLSLLEQEMQNNAKERQSMVANTTCQYESTEPMIVFDEREFRSNLPYCLYSRGIDLVPLTLMTADYVLSPEYAIERKSVKDYNQSLQSGRIFHQLAALSRRYTHPMCLIEFNRSEPFRLTYSTVWRSSLETSSMSILYGRTARLMGNYPQVRFVWARSPAHSAAMMLALKQGPASDNVDVTDPLLTGRGVDGEDGQLGGGAGGGGNTEAAHYAARVLARFPGVTPTNIQAVMELSGSLAGLATISQQSFANVMGSKAAQELYEFLHNPLAETVEEREQQSPHVI